MVAAGAMLFGMLALLQPFVAERWANFFDTYGDCVATRVLVPWALSTVFYWSYGLLLLAVEFTKRPAWFYKRKFQPLATMTNTGGDFYHPPLARCLASVLFSQVCVILPGLLFLDWLTRGGYVPGVAGIRMERELPTLQDMGVRSVCAVLLVELFFFTSHRILHLPAFWWIHKQHHEFKAPIALAAIYAHPIEVLVGNTFAVMGPAFLCSFHAYHWCWAIVIGFFSTQSSHSGYMIDGRQHDLHHQFTHYNYGTLMLLDRLFGTYIPGPLIEKTKNQ